MSSGELSSSDAGAGPVLFDGHWLPRRRHLLCIGPCRFPCSTRGAAGHSRRAARAHDVAAAGDALCVARFQADGTVDGRARDDAVHLLDEQPVQSV